MRRPAQPSPGFSLIELLVVLSIVGVLAVAGVVMLTPNNNAAVRGLLDELEGTLAGAQAQASATGQDVMVVTQGDWSATTGTPLVLAYDNSSLGSPTILTNAATAPNAFRLKVVGSGLGREHASAGVATAGTSWFADAAAGSDDITGVPPFNVANSGFQNILGTTSSNLFQGGATAKSIRVSGTSQRFASTFWVEVVALRNGNPVPGGPMGVLVVLANGATVYKFYNPGSTRGNGKWRKI